MGIFIDLTGKKYNKLTVLKRVENKNKQTMWLCQCDCGNKVIVSGGNLKNGHTTSCGCYSIQNKIKRAKEKNPCYKHGLYNTRLNRIWNSMKKRCYLKTHKAYKNYGGRGIKVCDEWLDKENGFINFYHWAMSNGYKEDLTIDRIDTNGNYEPNNCRWATREEQQNNKRNNHYLEYGGEIHTLAEWSKKNKINYNTLLSRFYNKKELFSPVKYRR